MNRRTRLEKEREKQIQDRLQVLLTSLLRDDDNKYCVDCDSKGPRWASWNIGIFLCIRCAGIHRNLGVHISRVKSVNLDSWTPHQVASMQQMGNSRARAVFEANLPEDHRRPQTESALETFIRAKYEKKKYVAKEWVSTKPPDFPEGWSQLIEAEKQKKDIRKIMLPSHAIPAPPSTNKETPRPSKEAPSDDLLGLTNNGSNTTNGKAASPSASLVNTSNTETATVDLLGIDSPPTTPCGSFAALSLSTDNSKSVNSSKPSEDDFFSQPASTKSSDTKMSKDSIMALFAQSGPTRNNAFGSPQPFMQSYTSPQQQPIMGNSLGATSGFNQGVNQLANPFISAGLGQTTPQQAPNNGSSQMSNQLNGLNIGSTPNGSNGLGNLMSNINTSAPQQDSSAFGMWGGF